MSSFEKVKPWKMSTMNQPTTIENIIYFKNVENNQSVNSNNKYNNLYKYTYVMLLKTFQIYRPTWTYDVCVCVCHKIKNPLKQLVQTYYIIYGRVL